MSITAPSEFTKINVRELTTSQNIVQSDWKVLVDNQNYLWTRQINHIGGFHFRNGWSTTSTSFTTSNIDNHDLSNLRTMGRLTKVDDNGDVGWLAGCVIAGMEIEITVFTFDPGYTQIAQQTVSESSGSRSWVFWEASGPQSDLGLENDVTFEIRAKYLDDPGTLYQFEAWEYVVTSSGRIPTQLDV